ncbi:ferredoxin [Nocardia carnea]|uniref:ferredoxin n=1 Tax=Nocardia carnea TaxID=37328 RepID=UPI002458F0E9|nr:ferredoxin [Nocardia carnea]
MSTASTRLVIDRTACAGHGMCYSAAPDLVESDEQGDPVVLLDPIPDTHRGDADTAVAVCPERALSLTLISPLPATEESSR